MNHHLYGGSSAHVWSKCNASPYLNALFPQQTNEAMERGTRIHAFAAALLEGKPTKEIAYDEEQVARTYAKDVLELGGHREIELYVMVKPLVGGSADVIVRNSDGNQDLISVIDLKTGHTPVSAKDNLQLLFYWWLWSTENEAYRDVAKPEIRLGIWHEVYQSFDWWYPTPNELTAAAELFTKQTTTPPRFVPGPHCDKCRASSRCTVAATPTCVPGFNSDEFIASEFEKIPVYEGYIKSLEAQATGLAQEGRLAGYRIGAGRKKAMKWLTTPPREIGNVSVYQEVPLTPTQVAKLIGKDGESYLMSAALASRPEPEQALIRE